jgi:hypothetical protein
MRRIVAVSDNAGRSVTVPNWVGGANVKAPENHTVQSSVGGRGNATQQTMYTGQYTSVQSPPQSQSGGPVHFLIFCPISISLLASLVADRRPQCSAGPP